MIFDVIIIGGGPAGCTAAIELMKRNISVAIIDPATTLGIGPSINFDHSLSKAFKVGESLPGSARPLLAQLGLLELIESGSHLISHGNKSYWGSEQIQEIDFIWDPSGPGWHLDRARFDADLRAKTVQAGVNLFNSRVEKIQKTTDGWSVKTFSKDFECAFLIDASGRNSLVARQQKIKRSIDDQLTCAYFWIDTDVADQDSRTLIEAVPSGWWYTSKLPGQSRVIAFHSDADIIAKSSHDKLLKTDLNLTTHIKKFFCGQKILSNIFRQGAGGSMLDQCAGSGWLSCGDAAMTFDPLSSQGLYNAIYSGSLAARTVKQLIDGNRTALLAYDQRLNQIRNAYLRHHQIFYALETRWPAQLFWQRRWPRSLLNIDHSVGS